MSFEAVHNYYEKLVQEHLNTLIEDPGNQLSEDEIDDIACIALNTLPPRYIKHNVDVLFYVSEKEHSEMTKEVIIAIKKAIQFVKGHPREE
jgi:predicted Zn-dependent protease with MMP-like domain